MSTYIHVEARVMVRESHVSDVQEPDVTHVQNLVVSSLEEFLKVFRRLEQLTEPNHGWQVILSSLEESASELDIMC